MLFIPLMLALNSNENIKEVAVKSDKNNTSPVAKPIDVLKPVNGVSDPNKILRSSLTLQEAKVSIDDITATLKKQNYSDADITKLISDQAIELGTTLKEIANLSKQDLPEETVQVKETPNTTVKKPVVVTNKPVVKKTVRKPTVSKPI